MPIDFCLVSGLLFLLVLARIGNLVLWSLVNEWWRSILCREIDILVWETFVFMFVYLWAQSIKHFMLTGKSSSLRSELVNFCFCDYFWLKAEAVELKLWAVCVSECLCVCDSEKAHFTHRKCFLISRLDYSTLKWGSSDLTGFQK